MSNAMSDQSVKTEIRPFVLPLPSGNGARSFPQIIIDIVVACASGAVISSVLVVWRGMRVLYEGSVSQSGGFVGLLHVAKSIVLDAGAWFTLIAFLVSSLVALAIVRNKNVVGVAVYRFRYVIAIAILVVLVIFGLSGSSIGLWETTVTGHDVDGLLAGVPRNSRTDEWAMFTAMTFAQFMDPSGELQYFSSVFRGVPTDMFILYGQPVWDIAIIFRPFQWGYLLLGLERGLAFFWFGRLIALFMATFEFGMLLTRNNKMLSLGFAALIAFAPVVQWWFSINGFVEMIVFMEIIVLCMRLFFMVQKIWQKLLLCIPLIIAAGGFALALYPAWEIPLTYVTLALLIGVLIDSRHDMRFLLKQDVPILLAGCSLLAAGLLYVMMKSHDAISATLNTAYPGSRINVGGGGLPLLLRSPFNYFAPYVAQSQSLTLPVDAGSAFIDLFPLGIILAVFVLIKTKKCDAVLVALLVVAVFLGAYVCIGFPEWLAKVTLMSQSMSLRCVVVLSLVNILLLIRSITVMDDGIRLTVAVPVALACSVAVAIGCKYIEPEAMGRVKCAIVVLILFVGMLAFLRKRTSLVVAWCCATALVAGLPVNPLQQGLAPVTGNPVIQGMRKVVESDPDATWFSAVDWQSNMTALAGAHSLDTTNAYPNPEFWKKLGGDNSNSEIWNRYAHIHAAITDKDSNFKLIQPDAIEVKINPDDLRSLDVRYVLINDDTGKQVLDESGIYRQIVTEGNYSIYQRK